MAFDTAVLSNIAEIRSMYQMVIPEYQRGYAWGEGSGGPSGKMP